MLFVSVFLVFNVGFHTFLGSLPVVSPVPGYLTSTNRFLHKQLTAPSLELEIRDLQTQCPGSYCQGEIFPALAGFKPATPGLKVQCFTKWASHASFLCNTVSKFMQNIQNKGSSEPNFHGGAWQILFLLGKFDEARLLDPLHICPKGRKSYLLWYW